MDWGTRESTGSSWRESQPQAYGKAPGGKTATKFYVERDGWLAGVRWRKDLQGGFNDLTVVHGRSLLEGISLYGNSAYEQPAPGAAQRWRFVDSLVLQPTSKFGLFAGAALELWDPKSPGAQGRWFTVGARPVFFFSSHYQLAFEAGHSVVLDRSEKNTDGSNVGARTLTRFTLAPQLSVGPGLWARPLLRAYYTRSFWNGANRIRVAADAPSFAGSLSSQAIGFQAEVWF